MKLKDLTKEQRVSIEADEIGRALRIVRGSEKYSYGDGAAMILKTELTRTIKRIVDEIEFTTIVMPIDDNCNLIDMNCECVTCTKRRSLEQQKQLYELMETLE